MSGAELEEFVDSGFLRQAQPNLQAYWQHSSDDERILLALLALLDASGNGTGYPWPAKELQRWYRRASSVLNVLTRRGLLTHTDDAYDLFSSAFSQWIATEITSPSPTPLSPEELGREEELLLASLPREAARQIGHWLLRTNTRHRSLFLKWLSDPQTAEAVYGLLTTGKATFQEVGEIAASAATTAGRPATTVSIKIRRDVSQDIPQPPGAATKSHTRKATVRLEGSHWTRIQVT